MILVKYIFLQNRGKIVCWKESLLKVISLLRIGIEGSEVTLKACLTPPLSAMFSDKVFSPSI